MLGILCLAGRTTDRRIHFAPPISFIRRVSGFCCYLDLREITTLDVLESPTGWLWHRDRSMSRR